MSTENEEQNNNESQSTAFLQGAGWQLCPKCSGQGTVSKPPRLAGDISRWSDSVGQHKCNLCGGKMIISIATGLPPG